MCTYNCNMMDNPRRVVVGATGPRLINNNNNNNKSYSSEFEYCSVGAYSFPSLCRHIFPRLFYFVLNKPYCLVGAFRTSIIIYSFRNRYIYLSNHHVGISIIHIASYCFIILTFYKLMIIKNIYWYIVYFII